MFEEKTARSNLEVRPRDEWCYKRSNLVTGFLQNLDKKIFADGEERGKNANKNADDKRGRKN